MLKHLIIDWGNTAIKVAVFERGAAAEVKVFEHDLIPATLEEFIAPIEGIVAGILSSVTDRHHQVLSFLQSRMPFLELTEKTPLPFSNQYGTPSTLGKDRIAAVAGVQATFPDQAALVIDAGTCITYDAVSADGIYRGGVISPGLTMRLKAMHKFTDKLPLVEVEAGALEGNSTTAAMQSGAYHGLVAEINGIIARYESLYDNLQTAMTGGDYKVLASALKNPIFADPNLVLKGLNVILEYNRRHL